MSAVEDAVAALAREQRSELWPRFTARKAGVTTAEAREAMLELVGSGLLDLWYVVISPENGDEVERYKHPDPAPIGQVMTNFRADSPETFEVEPDDIYLMFSPTERLARFVRAGSADPKVAGAASGNAPAPVQDVPEEDERADRSPRWDSDAQIININIEKLVMRGDIMSGDKVGRDKIGRDKIGCDRVGGSKTTIEGDVSGEVTGGDKSVEGVSPPNPKKGGGWAVLGGLAAALVLIVLGILDVLGWAIALTAAGVAVAAGALLLAYLRR